MMSVRYIKMNYLDASAAVKLVWREPGFENIRNYFAKESGFLMTSLCLAETLGVLKRKMHNRELSENNYFDSCWGLLGYLRSPAKICVDEIELSSLDTFAKAEEIARRYKLDLSNSLPLVSV